MKIAMIGHKRVPSREGGIEIAVEELAARMVEKGHHVDLYNRWERGIPKSPAWYRGIHMINIPTFRHSALNAFVYSFFAAVRAVFGHYDLIHFHAEGPCAMILLAKLFRIPTAATIHGLDWQRAKWGGFATRYLLLGEKIAAKNADVLIVLSRANQRYFKDTYGRDTYFISNGVNIKPYVTPENIHEKWGLGRESYLLFLARLVPEKGLHYLIQAYKKIETDKKLVIAGKLDKKNEYVQEICKMAGEDERILLVDFVQGRVLEELLSNCFLYILPSDVEGMAISLLEAMSYGVRCLVSDIAENLETSQEFARYFEKGNIEILKNRIEMALQESENSHNSYEQIHFVSRKYNWDVVVDDTLKLYESVMRN